MSFLSVIHELLIQDTPIMNLLREGMKAFINPNPSRFQSLKGLAQRHRAGRLRIPILQGFSFLAIGFFIAVPTSPAYAQTVTTYTYDAQGRAVTVSRSDNVSQSFVFDDVNNITNITSTAPGSGGGGGTGGAPTCLSASASTSYSGGGWPGTTNCTDPDGDPLTVTAVTDPPGATTAAITNNTITMNNLQCGVNSLTRTVSDGNGNDVTSTFTVTRSYHPWYAPGC